MFRIDLNQHGRVRLFGRRQKVRKAANVVSGGVRKQEKM
jgi:hypothetical protein